MNNCILSRVARGDWPDDRHGNPSAGCPQPEDDGARVRAGPSGEIGSPHLAGEKRLLPRYTRKRVPSADGLASPRGRAHPLRSGEGFLLFGEWAVTSSEEGSRFKVQGSSAPHPTL